ncbi:MAG: secretin N-terminal domain-containing protein [Nitrospirota bacterium]
MKKIFIFLIVLLTFLAYITSSSIADDLLLKVFQINYRKAEEMEKAVEMLLSPEGRISVDKRTNSLIVKDYPANIRAVADFLKEQDRKIQQVRIKIRYVDDAALKRAGMDVKWQYRGGHWAIGNIMSNKKGMNIDTLLGAEKERQKVTGEQTLLVMSGSEGRIAVGRSIPYTDWFYWYTKNRGYMIKETKFKDVSTGFVVRPRVAGSNINIDISPQISYFSDGRMNEVIYREASTTIICKNGETVLIGSSDTNSQNIVGNIFGGLQASKSNSSFYMLLTPEVMK